MKKILIVLLSALAVTLLILIAVPFLFKDKIKAAVDEAIAQNINANVHYDTEKLGLSIFSNFPNISVSLGDFSVVNNAPFEGDTLASVKEFKVVVDIMSLISGDKMVINSVLLDQPKMLVQVTKDGKASWDITKPSADTSSTTSSEPSNFSLSIKKWEIVDGYLIYNDLSLPLYAKILHLNHTGSGDLKSDIFDMITTTTADELTVVYDTVTYLNKVKFSADMTMNMDMAHSKYTFKENKFTVNAFALGFDGSLAMPADSSLVYDLTFAAKETEFRNILSLVPGVFTKDFDKLKTDGVLAFDGYCKGVQKAEKMPGFGLNLKISKGMFQYPELPTAVTNVSCDLNLDNKDGVIDNMIVDLKKFHMDMGSNPVDAKVYVAGLTNMNLDANVNAKINLADVEKIYPVDGLSMKGLFALVLKAKGSYNKVMKKMPVISAQMNLWNGYVKSKDFPKPLENMSISALATNPTGSLNDTKVVLDKLSFLLDGEPLNMSGNFKNFEDLGYDVKMNGVLDLGKLTKIFPLDSMTLSGKILADIATMGKMSILEAGQYDKLTTSGKMDFQNFEYKSLSLPQGFKISEGHMNFTPEKINIAKLNGFLGKSDIDVKGFVSNYMGYIFNNGTIKGQMSLNSNTLDVNEWLSEDKKPSKTDTKQPEEPMTATEVPQNIDFVMNSSIKSVLYSNYGINNLLGDIIIRDGMITMKHLAFNMLDGSFVMSGNYDPRDLSKPKFTFDFDMQNASISKAYTTFNAVQAFAPAAKNIEGTTSTKFKLSGELKKDMSPVLSTFNGNGMIKVVDAIMKNNKIMNKLADFTKNESLRNPSMKNTLVQAEIKDGRVHVKPFDLKTGGLVANISGSQGLDGSLDYLMKMDVPTGQIGAAASDALGKLAGISLGNMDKITLNFKIGGTSNNPTVLPVAASGNSKGQTSVTNQAKEAVKQQANQKLEEVKQQAKDKALEEADKLKKEAEENAQKQIEEKLKGLGKKFGF
jgi:hypothetical protein